jgi:hypothetical protein
MSPRFITNLLVLLAGGFVVVASQSFGAGTTGWIAFGIALGILGVTAVAQRERRRGAFQTALDAMTGSLAGWPVVASVVFTGSALTWLSFADALGFVALAVVGLVAHEFSTERVVNSLAAPERRDATVTAADSYSAAA